MGLGYYTYSYMNKSRDDLVHMTLEVRSMQKGLGLQKHAHEEEGSGAKEHAREGSGTKEHAHAGSGAKEHAHEGSGM